MSNTGDYDADYDTRDPDRIDFSAGARGNVSDSVPLVVGILDSTGIPYIIDGNERGIFIYNYDLSIGDVVEAYDETGVIVHSPITLFDGDDDGYDELYFCGVQYGNSSFFAYEINSTGSLVQKWSSQVADGVTTPDQEADKGCGLVRGTGINTFQTIYSPVCAPVSGTDYCFYVGGTMDPTRTDRQDQFHTIYRFDAETGSRSYLNPASSSLSYTECNKPSINLIVGHGMLETETPTINNGEKVVLTPFCDLDDDGNDELIVLSDCFVPGSGTDSRRGVLLVNPSTMQPDTSLSSDGFLTLTNDDYRYMSSPLCVYDGSEYISIIGIQISSDSLLQVWDAPAYQSNLQTGLGADFRPDANEISNLFIGEYTGDGNQDVCIITDDETDTTSRLACAKYVGLTGDILENDLFTYTGAYDLNPTIVADSTGVSYDLGGSTFDDVMTPYGIFKNDADAETTELMTYGYLGSTGYCSMADVDDDGEADVLCVDDYSGGANYTFYLTQSPNSLVDFIKFVPGVSGEVMCTGNQSFYIGPVPDYYMDNESDDVRVRVSCTNNGTWDYEANYSAYNSTFEPVCVYNESDTYTAKVCMDDDHHQGSLNQCGYYTTVVSDIEGCTNPCYPDCLYDGDPVLINPVTPGDDEPSAISVGQDEAIENFFDRLLGTSPLLRLIAGIAIIIATMYEFQKLTKSSNPALVLVVGGLTAVLLTAIGFLSAWILILCIIIMALVVLFGRTLSNGQGSG